MFNLTQGFPSCGSHQGSVITVKADGAQVESLEMADSGWDLAADDAGVLTVDASYADNPFTRNGFGFNLHQVELAGAAQANQWSFKGVGNQWHDAMPLDLNGDGISEWPHHEVDLMGEQRETLAEAQLLTGSPGIRILEWALRRSPLPRMGYVTDPHPLTRSFGHD